MKQNLLLLSILIVVFASCKKTEDKPQQSNTDKPVVQYLRYKIISQDSTLSETISFEKSADNQWFCSASSGGSRIQFEVFTNMNNSTDWQSFNIQAFGEGSFELSENNSSWVNLRYTVNGKQLILSNISGEINIKHFPERVSDYVVGTFYGTFINSSWNGNGDTIYVYNGEFSVMQTN